MMSHNGRCFTRAAKIGWFLVSGGLCLLDAQQPQIPSLQVCNLTTAQGTATVSIQARKSVVPVNAGTFTLTFAMPVNCNPPGTPYPAGQFTLKIDMTDTNATVNKGTITSTSIEQVTTTGHDTPTLYMNGRCTFPPAATGAAPQPGCRYWLMIADNVPHVAATAGSTPEVIGFLIFDAKGDRVAYGTGPVTSGHITVGQTSN